MSECAEHEYGQCEEEDRFGDLVVGWNCGTGVTLMTYGGADLDGADLREVAALLTRLSQRAEG